MENTSEPLPAPDFDHFDYLYESDVLPFIELAGLIDTYASPVMLAVGSLGNVTSLAVLCRLSRKVLSTCLYLAVLCVADLAVLYTRCANLWITSLTGYDVTWDLMIRYDIICKSLPFAFNFMLHLSKWLVVATAVEGVIATGFPQRSAILILLIPSSHRRHGHDCLVLSCPGRRCEQNWRQVKNVSHRKFLVNWQK